MDQTRRRMAIGVFATLGDAESVVTRLTALGITHFERLPVSSGQATAVPAGEALDQSVNLHPPEKVMLRIYLQTRGEEQIVAATLLDSDARSVQLHDVDPPASGSRSQQ